MWWIGTRLIEERERACDEEVLRRGSEPKVYAEAILNICKQYLESPLACVSGITSSDLKKRIHNILAYRIGQNLTLAKKLLLSVAGCTALFAPVAIGSLNGQISRAQSSREELRFESLSVRPSNSTDRRPLVQVQRDGQLVIANLSVNRLIQIAYGIKGHQISGGPDWMRADLFDITAKPEGSAKPDQLNVILQSVLSTQFHLVVQRDVQAATTYALRVADDGLKLKEVHPSNPNMEDPMIRNAVDRANSNRGAFPPDRRLAISIVRRGLLIAQGTTMSALANHLSDFLGSTVTDETGLPGMYDLKLQWQPDKNQLSMFDEMRVAEGHGAPLPDPLGPTLFTALQEQLGLRLESASGTSEIFVVEQVERPLAK